MLRTQRWQEIVEDFTGDIKDLGLYNKSPGNQVKCFHKEGCEKLWWGFGAPKDHSGSISENGLEKNKIGWTGEMFRK